MSDRVKISHPKSGEIIKCVQFYAFGSGPPELRGLDGVLVEPNRGRQHAGWTVQQPPFWIIVFQNTPPGTYDLVVTDRNTGKVLARSEKVNVSAGDRLLTMVYPAPGDTICPNFVTYGTTDQVANVSGTLSGSLPSPPGTPMYQPGPFNMHWGISFTGVDPRGSPYNLDVTNTLGASAAAHNLTVNSSAC